MNGRGITLFKLFGFEVKLNFTWLVLGFLITWTLARGFFPTDYPGLTPATYWIMGAIGAVGIFFSIVIHEFSHSLVARRFAVRIKSITLMIFGGVAEMDEEPTSPRAEFFMSIAGPLASVLVAFFFWLFYFISRTASWPIPVLGVFRYLRDINFILAVFNMVPAYPLDGGRVLRSALWKWRGDIRQATRISSAIGSGFGILLIGLAVFWLFSGLFLTALWWGVIGFFLRYASRSSYQQTLIFETLKGERVGRFMKEEVVSVDPDITIERLVEDYVYKYHFKMLPVARDGELMGCVTTREVKNIPREEWEEHTVREIYSQCTKDNSIDADEDATTALKQMHQSSNSRLVVTKDGKLAGVLSLKDMLRFLSMKLDLEDGGVFRRTFRSRDDDDRSDLE